ncbi:MAG: tRNA pseudouridine(55) synthase TruB [Rhodocyclaceae bacterium]|nr:tRNA pseudouridine(55) synthase TruB [Rhodocyclaceae bacterium]
MNKPRRAPRRKVDGVLLLDKPLGISSNAALQKARWLFNAAKAGHTGTLDPLATGLLPLCFGEATKFSSTLLDADKTYLATVKLGVVTATADAEGQVLATHPVTATEAEVRAVLVRFTGAIEQLPPMYSALKRDGTPLYELARQGIEVDRTPRRVTIHALDLLAWRGENFDLTVTCSKGTYVRTLAADIGSALGCGAHLAALRRTRVGMLDLTQAITLEAIEALPAEARDSLLQPPDTLLAELPIAQLNELEAAHILKGQPVRSTHVTGTPSCQRRLLASSRQYRLFGPQGFIGLGEVTADGWLAAKRLIATN